ncbi:MAG TPA: hypothetical protein PLQ12_10475 [Candidatus Defluviicoccus seviourii]|nr:hypothetical protein [Candidatus Defluviicoccus seviourii]
MKFDWHRLFRPWAWIQQGKTSWEWDALLNDMLDNQQPVALSEFAATICGVEVWTGNWPYAYGSPYGASNKFLPSMKTRLRLKRALGDAPKRNSRMAKEVAEIRKRAGLA